MKGTFGAAVLLLPVMTISLPAQQHFPTNEDLRHLRTISSPQLSPDLKQVVVTLQDSTADGGRTRPWLLSTDGSPYRQLTFNQGESSAERSDTTDPEGQSNERYRALRQEGVLVQLLLFPREDHGAPGGNFAGRASTEPSASVIAREHIINFISDAFAGKVEPNKS